MSKQPTVWLVIGDKLGDNAQVEIVAEALGWPFERKCLVFKSPYVTGKPRFVPSLFHVDLDKSDSLSPPWPDLVITIGRRPAMAALWIKAQSGGRTKLVLFGRPKREPGRFDLIVAPAQYLMPSLPNLVQLALPLIQPDGEKVRQASAAWRARLAPLPRPLVAVMVGGATKPYALGTEVVGELLRQVESVLGGEGSLYFSSSRRTPPEVIEALRIRLPANARLYRFGMDPPKDNPYHALLGLADAFVVTGDSVSMMVEAVRLHQPLAIFPLPLQGSWSARLRQCLIRILRLSREGKLLRKVLQSTHFGMLGFARDLEAVHRFLYQQGWAVPLKGSTFPFPRQEGSIPDEVPRVVASIQALFGEEAE